MNIGFATSKIQRIRERLQSDKPVGLADFVRSYFSIYEIDSAVTVDDFLVVVRALELKVKIMDVMSDPSTCGLRTILERRIAENEYELGIQNAADRHPEFSGSEAFFYVEKFVERFGKSIPSEELTKLQLLLGQKGFVLTIGELVYFVNDEYLKQHRKQVKRLISLHNPKTRRQFLAAYLDHFTIEDLPSLEALLSIFSDYGVEYDGLEPLKHHLLVVSRDIELSQFEDRLRHGTKPISVDEIDGLNGYEFEGFLKDLFTKMGYLVEQTRLSGDQGADLVVVKFGERTVIQAKCYRGNVGNYAVQEIFAALNLYGAVKGMVVTNSYFTPAAAELAAANFVELIDRDGLEDLITKYW